jgi:hypothetical protein
MLIAPIASQGEVVGVVASLRAGAQPWTRTDTSRVRIVAHQLGPVIETLAAPTPVTLLPAPPASAIDDAV